MSRIDLPPTVGHGSNESSNAAAKPFNTNSLTAAQAADSPYGICSILNTQERVDRQLIREMVVYIQLSLAQMFVNGNIRCLWDEKQETPSEFRIPSHKNLPWSNHLQHHCPTCPLETTCCHQGKEGFIWMVKSFGISIPFTSGETSKFKSHSLKARLPTAIATGNLPA